LAQQKRQQQMESEHLFASLLAQQGLAGRILEKAGVDLGSLSQNLEAFIAAKPSLPDRATACLAEYLPAPPAPELLPAPPPATTR
jgi:ATP-dependent Clp protease ATP-binding subunit ClpA